MKDLEERKRMFTSLIVILRKKLNIDIPNKIINYFNNLDYSVIKHDIVSIKKYELKKKNYDSELLNIYNRGKKMKIFDINEILFDYINLNELNVEDEYNQILDNSFISLRCKRDILNNMNKVIKYEYNKRKILILSNKYEPNILNQILSIFDLFDVITKTENSYKLNIYLSNEKKIINTNISYLNADNINSGSTYPGHNITLWRKEELCKVLIHELIHYLKLDMYKFQDKFHKLYDNINLKGDICNPNEAYTEFMALIFFTYWKLKQRKKNNNIKKFFRKTLLLELGWSYFQIAKIINFFKCYNQYEDLYDNKCSFKQKTNVLSYFLLKSFLLKNIKNTIDCIDFDNFIQNEHLTKKLLKTINLNNSEFSKNINWCMKYLNNTKYKFNNLTLRMTCLN